MLSENIRLASDNHAQSYHGYLICASVFRGRSGRAAMTAIFSEVDLGTWKYNPIEFNKTASNNGRNVKVLPSETSAIYKNIEFQLNEGISKDASRIVFGYKPGDQGPSQNPLLVSVALAIDNAKLEKFLDSVDERNIKEAVSNSVAWFKQDMDENVIRQTAYTFIKKTPSKPDQAPLVTVKIRLPGSRNPTEILVDNCDGTYSTGTVEDLQSRATCTVCIETSGLWFTGKSNFGMSLYASSVLVKPLKRVSGIDKFRTAPDETPLTSAKRPRDDELDDDYKGDA